MSAELPQPGNKESADLEPENPEPGTAETGTGSAGLISFVRYGVPVLAVAAAIFIVSQMSASTIDDNSASDILGGLTDEIGHFAEYLLLSALVLRWMLAVKVPSTVLRPEAEFVRKTAQQAVWIAIAYAITDEAHQLFVDGRAAEIKDLAIDAGGAIIGGAVYLSVYQAWRHQRARRTENAGG